MITTTITARNILRDYKNVFNNIKKTNQPAIVTSHKEPQVAIVSLEDLEKLQNLRNKDSTKNLLEFAEKARELLKDEKLPADLAINHDSYLWGK